MSEFVIGSLADVEAIEKVPLKERIKIHNTYEMLCQGAGINPEKVAIHFMMSGDAYDSTMDITYQQLLGRIHQTANLFHDLGVGKEDVVSMVLPNLPQCHFVIWGAEAAGIINPINPMLSPNQMKEIMQTAGTKVLVALGPLPDADIWEKVMSIRDEVPTLEHIIQVMGPGDEKAGIYSYDQVIDQYNPTVLDSGREIAPDEIAAMFHTGGTTGSPKLALQSHWNQVFLAWVLAAFAGATVNDVMLCGLPLFHANGVFVTGLTPFSVGAQVVLLTPQGYRDQGVIRNFYKIVEHFAATTFSGVPTLYAALLQVPVGDADVSSLRSAICGAAPMPVELLRAYEAYTGLDIMEGYGLTEGTCVSSGNPKDGESRIGSIGIRLPYQEMKTVILDAEGKYLRDCEVGEIGVVTIKGPNVFAGYLQEEHNRDAWVAEGWLNTGDLGRMDQDGYFWLTGRTKELIIRGGHNIDPAAIEGPLYDHPAVELAAAVGKPDIYAGEVPIVYVTQKEGAAVTEEELLEYAGAHIGERAAVPKEIHILDQMPMTAVGKIFKPELRWDAIRRVYANELLALGELVEQVDVTVREDKVHGTLVQIAVTPVNAISHKQVEERVKEILGKYTIAYTLEWK